MKISKQTIEILKNFATINQNLLIREGNVLMTRTVARTMFASATVDTDFPRQVGIYNLASFLGALSLFSDPDVEFGETSMTISQGKNKVCYNYADPEVLAYPDKAINDQSVDANFTLTEENLKSLLKAGAILGSTDICIKGADGKIVCSVLDPSNVSANTFSVEVGETDEEFDLYLKLENMKLLNGNYDVSLSRKMITKFNNTGTSYVLYIGNSKKESTWA